MKGEQRWSFLPVKALESLTPNHVCLIDKRLLFLCLYSLALSKAITYFTIRVDLLKDFPHHNHGRHCGMASYGPKIPLL